jgi:hypothetical protein
MPLLPNICDGLTALFGIKFNVFRQMAIYQTLDVILESHTNFLATPINSKPNFLNTLEGSLVIMTDALFPVTFCEVQL